MSIRSHHAMLHGWDALCLIPSGANDLAPASSRCSPSSSPPRRLADLLRYKECCIPTTFEDPPPSPPPPYHNIINLHFSSTHIFSGDRVNPPRSKRANGAAVNHKTSRPDPVQNPPLPPIPCLNTSSLNALPNSLLSDPLNGLPIGLLT